MDTKVCTKCGIEKPLEQFHKNKTNKDWLHWRCKECMKEYYNNVHKKVYEDNKEYILEQHKRRRQNNKEHVKEYKKKYNREHKKELWIQRERRRKEKWYRIVHQKTDRFILKNNLRHTLCDICWWWWDIEFHHPDYSKRHEWIFVCRSCHSWIHLWKIKQYNIINLLDLWPLNNNNQSEERE